mmetsp:Transcript_37306/g.73403  ORF Transcript_37306/g.73403 Transcript_37306/m.73403 type:complete len:387 (-) Transcript_37306:229-1389(-)
MAGAESIGICVFRRACVCHPRVSLCGGGACLHAFSSSCACACALCAYGVSSILSQSESPSKENSQLLFIPPNQIFSQLDLSITDNNANRQWTHARSHSAEEKEKKGNEENRGGALGEDPEEEEMGSDHRRGERLRHEGLRPLQTGSPTGRRGCQTRLRSLGPASGTCTRLSSACEEVWRRVQTPISFQFRKRILRHADDDRRANNPQNTPRGGRIHHRILRRRLSASGGDPPEGRKGGGRLCQSRRGASHLGVPCEYDSGVSTHGRRADMEFGGAGGEKETRNGRAAFGVPGLLCRQGKREVPSEKASSTRSKVAERIRPAMVDTVRPRQGGLQRSESSRLGRLSERFGPRGPPCPEPPRGGPCRGPETLQRRRKGHTLGTSCRAA